MKEKIVIALMLAFMFNGIALAQDAAAGKAVFTSKCSICHGPDGKGNTAIGKNLKIADLHSPDVQKTSDADMKALIINGKNKMLAFKGKLTDAQVEQVVSYIRELAK